MQLQVIYEDNHIIAVNKPAGMLSQGDKTGDPSIFDEVKKYLKDKYKKPGNVFLGLVQRLDRPVSGIMVFAKTSKGAGRLSEQFRNHTVEKIYHAVVIGQPSHKRGVLVNFLGKDQKLKKAKQFADGQEAKLYYEVIKTHGSTTLLKIKIDTGKFHQIRAQLSMAGFPILGDVKYLSSGRQVVAEWIDKESIALCATYIAFKAATEEKMIRLSLQLPKAWSKWV